jgi:hypothetical protein
VPAPRSHRSGGWATALDVDERRSDGPTTHAADEPGAEGSGQHAVTDRSDADPDDGSGADGAVRPTDDPDDVLLAALGGFTGTLGATNTAGLLSGYTPPSGLATSGGATALAVEADEVVLPTQRSGSGRWAAVADAADDELEPDVAATRIRGREHSPAALVSIGGAAAAVAVVTTLFLWPAPRTTNSAISRPAPLVPALTSPVEQTVELTPTPTVTPTTTHRSRPAPARTRRTAVPSPVAELTPAPTGSLDPTEPPGTTSEPPPSESTAPPTSTSKPEDDD